MSSIINNSYDKNDADCNDGTADCTYVGKRYRPSGTASCIQIQRGEDELILTANLAAQHCALTGGWGNVNEQAQFVSMAGPPPISATIS